MRHIEIGGGGLNVVDGGEADGRPVVFVNSLGTDLRIWDEVLERLPARLRVIRYDKRGHGLSDIEPVSRSAEAHAADLAGVLDALGVDHALVVGLSIGGVIAQALAAARPDLVAGLALFDTAPKIGRAEDWAARIAAVEAGGMESVADAIMERWFSAAFRAARPDRVAAWRALVARTPASGYVAACEALRDADLTAALGRIAVPTLFAVGSEDVATPPELVRAAAALAPGARFAIIEGAGHLPPLEKPEAVAALIAAELEEVARAAPV